MPFAIRHDRAAQRFLTEVDGAPCVLEYALDAAVMTITHTGVPPEVGPRTRAPAPAKQPHQPPRAPRETVGDAAE